GPGALLLGMSPEELATATRRALAAVPGAVGVNNHMGSGLLSQRQPSSVVLSVLAEHRLFFLDSRTSADTVGYSLARHLGLRAGERQVFLDTQRDPAFIQAQFDSLRTAARKRGGAIAIAHPYRETLAVLATAIPAAREAGFEFVTASTLIED
ncbi:MAG: divergent polysaccharide deacetylase family protein, partial [bacterium]|nr:divergent polysaccharide deacetylase family protein [bacterium]